MSPAERYLNNKVKPLSIKIRRYRSEAGVISGVLNDLRGLRSVEQTTATEILCVTSTTTDLYRNRPWASFFA
jgi:hypothetical protein